MASHRAELRRKRVRRRRRRLLLVRYWWLLPLAAFVVVAPAIWNRTVSPHASRDPLPDYIADTGKIEEEYLAFTGKPMDPGAAGQGLDGRVLNRFRGSDCSVPATTPLPYGPRTPVPPVRLST